MKFRLYKEFGALNSPPIFNAFAEGIKKSGHQVVDRDEDISVIWSVLWNGRMSGNRNIYNISKSQKKPVVIIEVGNLIRNRTWRVGIDNINGQGFFGNHDDLDKDRPRKLGISLKPPALVRKPHILITTQHIKSLQWENMPLPEKWLSDTIDRVRQVSSRPIVIRPHPRAKIIIDRQDCTIEMPKILNGSYDNYDISYDCHCVINHSSGPTVQAAIHGTPIICDSSGLAFPVSEKWENLENPQLPDREDWFLKLCHTEYLVEELAEGKPIRRLEQQLLQSLRKTS